MQKLRIFVSYARKDREFLERILVHLMPLQAEGLIEPWTDLAIEPGGHWDAAIGAELDRADIVLLLVSADFLASSYVSTVELQRALEREQRGEVVLIPVILKFADWATSPLHYLQALPTNARPITDWRNRDEAYLDVALGVRRVVSKMRGESPPAPDTSAVSQPAQTEIVRQDRVLDAAMAGRIPMGKPSDLAVMVRLVDSAGLKAILGADDEYTSQPEDVRSRPFQMEFERDARGGLKAEALTIRLESPDFDPPSQEESILVPSDRDSDVVTFLLRPLFPGELVVKLKVFARGGRSVMRLLRIFSEASDRAIVGSKVVVSIPIWTTAGSTTAGEDGPGEVTGMFGGSVPPKPAAAAPPLPQETPPPPVMMSMPPAASAPAARKRSWVLPSAGGLAAAVLVGTISIVYLAPNGTTPKPSDAMATPAAPPPVPGLPPPESAVRPAPSAGAALGGASGDVWVSVYQKGVMHGNAGDYGEAAKSFAQAARIAPEQPGPQMALATANLKLAESAESSQRPKYLQAALEGANRAAALEPDSAQARYLQGLALERSGHFADAESALQRAVELNPNDGRAWYALGLALDKQSKTDGARNALERSVRLDPANADARLLLASILADHDAPKAKEQIEILKKDTSLSPTKAAAIKNLQKKVVEKR